MSIAVIAAILAQTAGPVAASPRADELVSPGLISTPATEVRIAYRPDGKQILWGSIGRDADAGQQDIWEIHRQGPGWSRPARVSFDTDAVEFDPAFSRDGRHLYFDSDRSGGFGGTDIYVVDVEPAKNSFSAPRNAGAWINGRGDEWAATPTPWGTLIFASDSWGGLGKHDLLEGSLTLSRKPRNLGPAINGPEEDFDAAIAPDGATMVFSSGTMTDTAVHVTLFRSRLRAKAWTARMPLGVGCSDFMIGSAFASAEPRTLYYSASCPGGLGRMDIRKTALPAAR
jgi:Tol biopolymer transport system component